LQGADNAPFGAQRTAQDLFGVIAAVVIHSSQQPSLICNIVNQQNLVIADARPDKPLAHRNPNGRDAVRDLRPKFVGVLIDEPKAATIGPHKVAREVSVQTDEFCNLLLASNPLSMLEDGSNNLIGPNVEGRCAHFGQPFV
jgi:hypothetical protein